MLHWEGGDFLISCRVWVLTVSKSNKKTIAKLFDSGFWLGILFILEPIFILLFILIYLSIYLHNKITIHTLFTPLMGFISPLVIFFTYNFWFDKTEELLDGKLPDKVNVFKFMDESYIENIEEKERVQRLKV